MEKTDKPKEKGVYIDRFFLRKKDLLIILSWFDFIETDKVTDEDTKARELLVKIINYLTRNG